MKNCIAISPTAQLGLHNNAEYFIIKSNSDAGLSSLRIDGLDQVEKKS